MPDTTPAKPKLFIFDVDDTLINYYGKGPDDTIKNADKLLPLLLFAAADGISLGIVTDRHENYNKEDQQVLIESESALLISTYALVTKFKELGISFNQVFTRNSKGGIAENAMDLRDQKRAALKEKFEDRKNLEKYVEKHLAELNELFEEPNRKRPDESISGWLTRLEPDDYKKILERKIDSKTANKNLRINAIRKEHNNQDTKLPKGEVFFFDDSQEHIKAAQLAGFNAYLAPKNDAEIKVASEIRPELQNQSHTSYLDAAANAAGLTSYALNLLENPSSFASSDYRKNVAAVIFLLTSHPELFAKEQTNNLANINKLLESIFDNNAAADLFCKFLTHENSLNPAKPSQTILKNILGDEVIETNLNNLLAHKVDDYIHNSVKIAKLKEECDIYQNQLIKKIKPKIPSIDDNKPEARIHINKDDHKPTFVKLVDNYNRLAEMRKKLDDKSVPTLGERVDLFHKAFVKNKPVIEALGDTPTAKFIQNVVDTLKTKFFSIIASTKAKKLKFESKVDEITQEASQRRSFPHR